MESPTASTSTSTETPDLDEKLRMLLPEVLDILKQIGRCDDFISVLESIVSGKLDVKNMALHLLLDVGQFLNANAPSGMRYLKTSLDYWLVIQKLFKGKGFRFFRGVKTGPAKKLKGMCMFLVCTVFM